MSLDRNNRWTETTLEDVAVKSDLGRYRIRGFSTFQNIVHFDDVVFLPPVFAKSAAGRASEVSTKTVLGRRFAKKPMILETPVYVTGMSYGALSKTAKV